MSISMSNVEYLSDKGLLPPGNTAILDIGTQNLFNVTPDAVRRFTRRHGPVDDALVERECYRLAYFSNPRDGQQTTYLSELFDLTPSITYVSYDVCPGLKTEIFDLNSDSVPDNHHNHFSVVLNFGTTEHVINQMNSFEVMHDAVKPDGVIYHQVPSVGWLDHGYVAYHEAFFRDLVKSNNYELLDIWYTPERQLTFDGGADIRDALRPQLPNSASRSGLLLTVQCMNLNVVVRKPHDRPFRVGLELATAHAGLSDVIQAKYGS